MSTYRQKLIEVALPLEAINAASAREKSIRYGHPSTLHLWWARRPLAAARAVLFAQLVDDPSAWPDLFPTEEAQNAERQRLFRLIEELVVWENSNDANVINAARLEIARSHARSAGSAKARSILAEGVKAEVVDEYLATEVPPVHDPFAGGGTVPLEAQRLGLRAIATDLNPVAVMINKALIEIPPKFAGMAPVNPRANGKLGAWSGAEGLADDVRYYGAWMRDEAKRRIGHLYPQVALSEKDGGGKATVIAWIWARTVPSPDPAFAGTHVPLLSTFWLSQKPGSEAWLDPTVQARTKSWSFAVRTGPPPRTVRVDAGTKHGRGDFTCLLSGVPIPADYIREIGRRDEIGTRLVAIALEKKGGRAYVTPTRGDEELARVPIPESAPSTSLPTQALGFRVQNYGLRHHRDLFTARQLVALTTFSDLVAEVVREVEHDARGRTPVPSDYAAAVGTYLAFAVDKMAEGNSALCTWSALPSKLHVVSTFGRQALSMIWDFAEANIFGNSAGTIDRVVENIAKVIEPLCGVAVRPGSAQQASAVAHGVDGCSISTDPPYYDNIGYAALSDFFYTWLRRSLQTIEPQMFATVLTPKDEEVIAEPGRFGGDVGQARRNFEELLHRAFLQMSSHRRPGDILTVYYAFKQSETEETASGASASSTGWETMLEALLASGFVVDATWPVRTEKSGGFREMNRNALASSVVLVCRKRFDSAEVTTRGEFRRMLRKELPDALKKLQQGNIAPVDVAQASIGPGMAIFSRHKLVAEADGTPMSVRSALQLINEVLDEYLASGEGDFDSDTRFAITWYEQHGWEAGAYGDAENIAKARNISVKGVVDAGVARSGAGKVSLLRRDELPPEYDPNADHRPTVWEFTQHMIRYLEEQGEEAAARHLKRLGARGDATRELAYRLYNTCERKKWAEDARSYNGLILAWPELEKLAARMGDEVPVPAPSKPGKKGAKAKPTTKGQQDLFEGDET